MSAIWFRLNTAEIPTNCGLFHAVGIVMMHVVSDTASLRTQQCVPETVRAGPLSRQRRTTRATVIRESFWFAIVDAQL